MIDKISVYIMFPALNVEHNFMIPWDMNIRTAIDMISKLISEEYRGVKFSSEGKNRLVQTFTGKVLPDTCSFRQLDLAQGEKLIFM